MRLGFGWSRPATTSSLHPSSDNAASSFVVCLGSFVHDGQAAIEFRSYHAGKTLIRATSPTLKDATIEITSLGEPKYIPGKTSPVKPLAHVRFSAAPGTASTITLGMNSPTRASSEALGHTARLANDGNPATFWLPNAGDTNAWLSIDLERIVAVGKSKLTFPTDGNWRYKLEISDDGENDWKLVADQTQNTVATRERIDTVQGDPPRGRFVRVSFTGIPAASPPALAEFEISGNLPSQ